MLRELNRMRAANHLPPLREDARMDRTAAGHSRDMARHGYFAHGAWPIRVMAAAGSARSIGEVIGWRVQGSPRREARAMVREWLGSPPHRRVLLDGGFRRVGIGRATSANRRPSDRALHGRLGDRLSAGQSSASSSARAASCKAPAICRSARPAARSSQNVS